MNTVLLFGAGPYLAGGITILGFLARAVTSRRHDLVDRSRIAGGWALLGRSRVSRGALLLLVVGHGLFVSTPGLVARVTANGVGLYLVEGAGFLLGLAALSGVIGGARRHLAASHGSLPAELADGVFLSALLLALACGLYTAARYRWASLWGAATVVPYLRSLATLAPTTSLAGAIPAAAQLHLVAAGAAVAALPFSRLGGALTFGALATILRAGEAVEAALRTAASWLRPQWLFALLWPEEDLMDRARFRLRRRRAAAQTPARRSAVAADRKGRPTQAAPGEP